MMGLQCSPDGPSTPWNIILAGRKAGEFCSQNRSYNSASGFNQSFSNACPILLHRTPQVDYIISMLKKTKIVLIYCAQHWYDIMTQHTPKPRITADWPPYECDSSLNPHSIPSYPKKIDPHRLLCISIPLVLKIPETSRWNVGTPPATRSWWFSIPWVSRSSWHLQLSHIWVQN